MFMSLFPFASLLLSFTAGMIYGSSLTLVAVITTLLNMNRQPDTLFPSMQPSIMPSNGPSLPPTVVPSIIPSLFPSISPSLFDRFAPSEFPSHTPSIRPTKIPSTIPSLYPSTKPSLIPSLKPSSGPSSIPSLRPSLKPSLTPSANPTSVPSSLPSSSPSLHPSVVPSLRPSSIPSSQPTILNPRKINAFDGAELDSFGFSVDVFEETIVIGSFGDGQRSGSAYLYNEDGVLLTKLIPPGGHTNEYFGYSVAISSDRVVVGAFMDNVNNLPASGSAYVFDTDGNFVIKLVPDEAAMLDMFGESVAISGDTIAIGAPQHEAGTGLNTGTVFLYDKDGPFLHELVASDGKDHDNFGEAVDISDDIIVIGAPNDDSMGTDAGSAYIFNKDGTEVKKLVPNDLAPSDNFGYSVAISGDRLVVGSFGDDENGDGSGSAYIYTTSGDLVKKIIAQGGSANERFGRGVAINGDKVIIGADRDEHNGGTSGAAYVFTSSGEYRQKLIAPDGESGDLFGNAVAASDHKLVVGAYGDNDKGDGSGSVYIFYF